MLPRAVEQFEEWFHAPLPGKSSDPRFEVRPAHPTEFERLYDLVDEVFGVTRPRAVFDWLYRDNPAGVAHCWIVAEKATGRLLGQNASWPWPLAHGLEPHLAYLVGDSVVAPDWQRQGLAQVRHEVQEQHQVHPMRMVLGWPNEKTRARLRKRDRERELLGPLLGVSSRGRRPAPRMEKAVRHDPEPRYAHRGGDTLRLGLRRVYLTHHGLGGLLVPPRRGVPGLALLRASHAQLSRVGRLDETSRRLLACSAARGARRS